MAAVEALSPVRIHMDYIVVVREWAMEEVCFSAADLDVGHMLAVNYPDTVVSIDINNSWLINCTSMLHGFQVPLVAVMSVECTRQAMVVIICLVDLTYAFGLLYLCDNSINQCFLCYVFLLLFHITGWWQLLLINISQSRCGWQQLHG